MKFQKGDIVFEVVYGVQKPRRFEFVRYERMDYGDPDFPDKLYDMVIIPCEGSRSEWVGHSDFFCRTGRNVLAEVERRGFYE